MMTNANWKRSFSALVCGLLLVVPLVVGRELPEPSAQRTTPTTPPTQTERRVPFVPGEVLTYGVSWSNFLSAGTATISVIEKKRSFDSVAYYIVAEARPSGLVSKLYHLYYKLDTLMDAYTLLPQRGSMYSEEGRRRRFKTLVFDRTRGMATYELKTATLVTREVALPPSCHDALSVLYALRGVALKIGDRIRLPVVESGKIYQVQFAVTGRETVGSGLGPAAAWRVVPTIQHPDGRTEESGIVLWISDDARKAPVKIRVDLAVGSFNLLLKTAVP